jgi:hypothetical protein
MPSTASTSTPCRSACCCICDIVARRSAPWISNDPSSITGTATSGTKPSGPPMTKVMAMKMTMNGRSDSAASVAEAKNSRTCSICARLCAKAPADAGRCSMRIASACLNSALPTMRSLLRPAMSIR